MEKYSFSVAREHAGERLDKFLVSVFPRFITRSIIKKLVDNKNVLVNGKTSKCHHKVSPGENIDICVPETREADIQAQDIPLDILYEDEQVIVINKPAGLVVHPGAGNHSNTLVNALLYHCRYLSSLGGALRPGLVHRLDKDTSGIMVVAKTDLAHDYLARQFKNRSIRRTYIAFAKDIVQLDNGVVDAPIGRHVNDRQKMAVKYAAGKEAVTKYRVLERFKDFTMLELSLSTGRTHQIRVHLAHIGHPLLGDAKYGSPKGMPRQALHAKTLAFTHPTLKKRMSFDSDLPEDMIKLIKRAKLWTKK